MAKRFSKIKPFDKTNVSKIPKGKPIVYYLKSKANKGLYVGIAKKGRTQERLLEHLTKKSEKIPGAKKFQTLPFRSIKGAKQTEKRLIKKLNPKYNK